MFLFVFLAHTYKNIPLIHDMILMQSLINKSRYYRIDQVVLLDTPASYLGDPGVKSQPGDRLS
jgi:hypothetical protein